MQRTLCLLAVAFAASVASAQHADINPYVDEGQIALAYYNYDNVTVTPTSVFAGRFDSFYAVNDPGFSTEASGSGMPGNTALGWDFLPMTNDGYTSALLYWDGLGDEPDFGPAPTDLYSITLFGRDGPVPALSLIHI